MTLSSQAIPSECLACQLACNLEIRRLANSNGIEQRYFHSTFRTFWRGNLSPRNKRIAHCLSSGPDSMYCRGSAAVNTRLHTNTNCAMLTSSDFSKPLLPFGDQGSRWRSHSMSMGWNSYTSHLQRASFRRPLPFKTVPCCMCL